MTDIELKELAKQIEKNLNELWGGVKCMEDNSMIVRNEDRLFEVVSQLIDKSRQQVAKAINTTMVYTYYGVGQYIVEYEQNGNTRAEYGKGVLKRLSQRLTEKYGEGWSYANLRSMPQFYLVYNIWQKSL